MSRAPRAAKPIQPPRACPRSTRPGVGRKRKPYCRLRRESECSRDPHAPRLSSRAREGEIEAAGGGFSRGSSPEITVHVEDEIDVPRRGVLDLERARPVERKLENVVVRACLAR